MLLELSRGEHSASPVLYRHPHPWHSRAGGGAVHSIRGGLMHCNIVRRKKKDRQRGGLSEFRFRCFDQAAASAAEFFFVPR
jgi:hypothetical protein